MIPNAATPNDTFYRSVVLEHLAQHDGMTKTELMMTGAFPIGTTALTAILNQLNAMGLAYQYDGFWYA